MVFDDDVLCFAQAVLFGETRYFLEKLDEIYIIPLNYDSSLLTQVTALLYGVTTRTFF